jgi:hypothetical protein
MNLFINKDVWAEPKKKSWFHISLEAFAATVFNETFSGRQPRQGVKVFLRFRNWLRHHLQVVADGLVELKLTRFGSGQKNFY